MYKFGFGRASDNVNEEIRYGRMSRDQGIELVEKYDGKCPEKLSTDFVIISKLDPENFGKL